MRVVKAPVVGVVEPTVPFILIDAVPVRFVTVPEDGVPSTHPFTTNAQALHTFTANAVPTFVQGVIPAQVVKSASYA